ncbi:MAG: hypothetical protein QOF37_3063 [Thermoleophilaceae bacterium]|jgi:hypothetical protein|nr:hypothetical protein [Thermoleophilaceae bacterium]
MELRTEAHKESANSAAPEARGDSGLPISGVSAGSSVVAWVRAHAVVPFGARPYAPALVWAVAMGAASALAPFAPRVALLASAAGVIAAVCILRGSLAVRALTALAMVPGADAHAPGWAWVLSGGLVAFLVSARGGPVELRSHDLQRHLDWCRRRQEKAHVLVLRFSLREVPRPARVLHSFRTTDSISLHYGHGMCELRAVLDDWGFSRAGVERRINDHVDASFRFGWAQFPENGVTLDTLMETARADLAGPQVELKLAELAESYA